MSDIKWQRVSRKNPCPVCNETRRCTVAVDGLAAKCLNIHDGNTAGNTSHDEVGAYTVHTLTEDVHFPPPADRPPRLEYAYTAKLAKAWHEHLPPERDEQLSQALGLDCKTLELLRMGWVSCAGLERLKTFCFGAGCWTFPMRSATGGIVGIRTRFESGDKRQITGTEAGIFIPAKQHKRRCLVVTEGPTDLAAAIELGLAAIGRPNNMGKADYCAEYAALNGYRNICLITDDDSGKEQAQRQTDRGAEIMRAECEKRGIEYRRLTPTRFKDVREYHNGGGSPKALQDAIARLFAAEAVAA